MASSYRHSVSVLLQIQRAKEVVAQHVLAVTPTHGWNKMCGQRADWDVIVKKVLEQGWDTRTTHYTHVGPMTPYIVV